MEQYKIQDKPEAKKAAEKQVQRTGERENFQDRSKRIDAYIERLENVFLNPDQRVRKRNIEILKPIIHENAIIKTEDFPESYFDYQRRELINRGLGEIELNDDEKQQEIAQVQEAQGKSLDAWIDHLSSDDSNYPADIKYFAMQGILKAGVFDQSNYRFEKRVKSTTAPFYQIDHEALSMTLGALNACHHNGDISPYPKELLDLIEKSKDFASMYAVAMRILDQEADKDKALEITQGEWRVFKQGSDPQELVKAFEGKRAYLCLGNIGDATGYLKHGDVQVYFSHNRAGQPIWPRAAIALKPETGVYEVRGTYNKNEDVDPEIAQTDIIKNQLALLPNGESFAKKDADMKKVTELVKKQEQEVPFTKDEILFLFEVNNRIGGFGFNADPRIAQLREKRYFNFEDDMSAVFGCPKSQIAQNINQITGSTKVFIGKLKPGVIDKLPKGLKHIYTSFPDHEIHLENMQIGGHNKEELTELLIKRAGKIMFIAKEMIDSPDFVTSQDVQTIKLVRLRVKDLGFIGQPNNEQLLQRAKLMGLDLCPAETALWYLIKNPDQFFKRSLSFAMKPIEDRDRQNIFMISVREGQVRLLFNIGNPEYMRDLETEFVFRRFDNQTGTNPLTKKSSK